MIKKFSFLAILCLSFIQAKAAFNTEGLPEGAGAFFYYSHEKLSSSQLGKVLAQSVFLKTEPNSSVLFKNGNPDKDFREAVVGIYSEKSPGESAKPLVVALLKGQFNVAKMKSTYAESKIPEQKINGIPAWDVSDLSKEVSQENKKFSEVKRGEYLLLGYSDNYLVLSPTSLASVTIETLQKKKKSAVLPANLAQVKTNSPNDWLIIRGDFNQFKQYPQIAKMINNDGILSAAFSIGEDPKNFSLKASSDFADADKAETSANQLRGFIALGMMTLPSTQKNPEDGETIKSLLQKVKISQNTKTVEMQMEYPADKTAQMIAKVLNKAMTTAQNQAGVARTETKENASLETTP